MMKTHNSIRSLYCTVAVLLLACTSFSGRTEAAVMNDYCIQPPFISQVVPPLVMFLADKEHRLFTEAYSDSFDLDDDGKVETTYKHSLNYYGYFDYNKCYAYSGTGNEFNPVSYSAQTGTDAVGNPLYSKFCGAGQWSGNILNWLTMSRMDALKKVLYGGQRVNPDSTNKTTLIRVPIPQDAHSFGKEYTGRLCTDGSVFTTMCSGDTDCDSGYSCLDKSTNLIGEAAPPTANVCAYTGAIGTVADKILVVKYNHPGVTDIQMECGLNHDNLLLSYEPGQYQKHFYLDTFNVDDATATNNDTLPEQDHGDHYNYLATAEFNVLNAKKGVWQFMVDGDEAVELVIDGVTVASKYALTDAGGSFQDCNNSCAGAPADLTGCDTTMTGSIDLSASGYHRLIVRHSELEGGRDGLKVWYKRPGDAAWAIFGQSANLTIRSPDITPAGASCTVQTMDFIMNGVPVKGTQQKYHLFCNKSTTGNNNSTGAPLLRMVKDRTERIWDWISREVVQCGNTLATSTAVTPTEYQVKVEVCNPTIGLESNCKQYGTGNSATQKPIGLLQKYGDSDGTKICTKTFAKSCNSDADCRPGSNGGTDLGMCVDKSRMYFGLLSGSYANNLQGGVLRKNVLSISDEVDMANGFFKTSQNIPSNMLETFDKLQIIDYADSTTSYATCVAQNENITNGKCRVWGNPLAEMLYESLRYFAGKGTPTTVFDYPQNQTDGGLNLPHPSYWGYVDGARAFKGPYDIYPSCSKPFILVLSDVYPSFDADQLPGVTNSAFTEDTGVHPVLGLDQDVSGKKFLSKLLDDIAATESVTNNSFFIGDNGTLYDFICTPKTASTLSLLRGLCPEQPTRKGSFYSAALAYYAHSFMNEEIKKDTTAGINNNIPNAQTFAVAVASQVGNWFVKVGGQTVRIVPLGKSVSGAVSMTATCKDRCTLGKTTFVDGSLKTMTITNCAANAYCPTNEIVKVYTHSVKYNNAGEPIYLSFRINFADAEQGADFDMDAVGWFEVCTEAARVAGYGTCGTAMNADQVEIKVVSDYAAGGIDQVLGFILSGTSEDGTYLTVRDKSVTAGTALPNSLPFNWSHVFTVTGSTTGVFKDPLWYTAKWGGFQDKNGNKVPDLKDEWAKECTDNDVSKCNPDNYYLAVNPLKLESQLEKAFTDILTRVSSGTAASILNNSEGSGANLLQAVFYPKKQFDNGTEVEWIGEMQNLWYFLDPKLQKTSIREDTNQNNTLNLKTDYVAQFYFDNSQNKTLVKRFVDANGDGAADDPSSPVDTITPDEVNSLWKAGRILWERDVATSPRTIYTSYNSTSGNTPQKFSNLPADGSIHTWPNTWNILNVKPAGTDAEREAEATRLIDYIHGTDQTGYRSRKATILNCGLGSCTREWKLGDIVSSTPKLVSNVRLNQYNLSPPFGYNDSSYDAFTKSATYKGRGMVFVGGNDGMLHAFKLGILKEKSDAFDKAMITGNYGDTTPATAADTLGKEMWSFIPKHSLPYLQYLTDPAYSHLYYIDKTSTIVDANIARPATCDLGTTPDISDCTRDASAWRTVLVGGMGMGGAAKATNDGCAAPANCVKTPIAGTGYSSYFALDVTDPTAPKYLWEFPNPSVASHADAVGTLGFTTTGPAIVRISAKVKDISGVDTVNPNHAKNGKWFAVFVSGPTGPIDTVTHSFKGESDQQLRIFIVDLATGALLRTITTDAGGTALPANAFGGSLATSVSDTDRSLDRSKGFYSDDVVYIGYVQKDTSVSPNTWTKGGVLRLLTKESRDPAQWAASKVIENIGPVTTSVTKLQDRKNNNLWLFFGTGRFFYKQDDTSTLQKIYGIKEPCYSTAVRTSQAAVAGGSYNDLDQNCTDAVVDTIAHPLVNQSGDISTAPATTIALAASGWYVNLDPATSSENAERVITDSIAAENGAVFFTTFKPSADICKFGGDSLIWALRYDSGGLPPAAAMQGKALMQVSTGAFAEISLSTAFKNPGNMRFDGRRLAAPISGVPPTAQGLSLLTNPRPIKKMLHVIEK